ncbi:unnamed protein product, partial [Hapterophycus canaliculatus]
KANAPIPQTTAPERALKPLAKASNFVFDASVFGDGVVPYLRVRESFLLDHAAGDILALRVVHALLPFGTDCGGTSDAAAALAVRHVLHRHGVERLAALSPVV